MWLFLLTLAASPLSFAAIDYVVMDPVCNFMDFSGDYSIVYREMDSRCSKIPGQNAYARFFCPDSQVICATPFSALPHPIEKTHKMKQNQQRRGQQKKIAKTTNPHFYHLMNHPIIVEVFIVISHGDFFYTCVLHGLGMTRIMLKRLFGKSFRRGRVQKKARCPYIGSATHVLGTNLYRYKQNRHMEHGNIRNRLWRRCGGYICPESPTSLRNMEGAPYTVHTHRKKTKNWSTLFPRSFPLCFSGAREHWSRNLARPT